MAALKSKFEQITASYVSLFESKQEMSDGYWIGEAIGGVLDIADMCLNFEDVRLDVDYQIKPGLIISWYWEQVDKGYRCNYKSWLKLNGHFPTES